MDDTTLHGLWVVITPTNTLQCGDVVRVVWQEPPQAYGYLVRRAASSKPLTTKTYMIMHVACLFAMHVPVMLSVKHDMEPYLVRSPHLVPVGGWMALLRDAGIGIRFDPPRSWQFYGQCWHTGDTLTGKTGGLHLSIHNNLRRSQLMVEYGVCGDSLVETLPHTRQGILMYVSCMNSATAARLGDVCYDTSMALSFSALLLAYIETLSLVRRAVYEHPHHPCGGVEYAARTWDYLHVPYTKPFPVASRDEHSARTINIAEFAQRKARIWLQAEQAANPGLWEPSTTNVKGVAVGTRVPVRLWKPGVTTWVEATVISVHPLTFDVPISPGSMAFINSRIVPL